MVFDLLFFLHRGAGKRALRGVGRLFLALFVLFIALAAAWLAGPGVQRVGIDASGYLVPGALAGAAWAWAESRSPRVRVAVRVVVALFALSSLSADPLAALLGGGAGAAGGVWLVRRRREQRDSDEQVRRGSRVVDAGNLAQRVDGAPEQAQAASGDGEVRRGSSVVAADDLARRIDGGGQ